MRIRRRIGFWEVEAAAVAVGGPGPRMWTSSSPLCSAPEASSAPPDVFSIGFALHVEGGAVAARLCLRIPDELESSTTDALPRLGPWGVGVERCGKAVP